ncbi:hypothetical protein F5B18DRAFT_621788 [Nemania serpens]|nr:hypothetical protein F5B18DRAFT_621788 [Nemania serpens]
MQFRTVALSLFVALAAADHISDLASQVPSCAQPCLASGAQKAGCDATDYKCQCSKALDITSNSALCVSTSCSSDDSANAYKTTTELCLAVAGQAGSDSLSSAIDSLTSAVGGAVTKATDAAGSAFTSATGAAGSAFTSATGAAGSAITSAVGSASAGAVPPATSTPAAANQAVAGMGMVGAAAFFALAL